MLFADGQEPDQAKGDPHEGGQRGPGQVPPDHPAHVRPLHPLFCALPHHTLPLRHTPLPTFTELPALEGGQPGLQDTEASGEPEQLPQPSPVLAARWEQQSQALAGTEA